jgi:TetR/AcrR family transcriptional repressor of nem operon
LIRHAVETVFEEWQTDIIDVLEAAQDAGELSETLDHDQIQALAASIIEGYEGALIRSKSQASSTPLERFCARGLKRLLS